MSKRSAIGSLQCRGGPCALPAVYLYNKCKMCGEFAVSYEFAAHFSLKILFAAGRGQAPPLRREPHFRAYSAFCNTPFFQQIIPPLGCHPEERSDEGSKLFEILRVAQDDNERGEEHKGAPKYPADAPHACLIQIAAIPECTPSRPLRGSSISCRTSLSCAC